MTLLGQKFPKIGASEIILIVLLMFNGAVVTEIAGTEGKIVGFLSLISVVGIGTKRKYGPVLAIILSSLAVLIAILLIIPGISGTHFDVPSEAQDFYVILAASIGSFIYNGVIIWLSCLSYKKASKGAFISD